MDPLFVVAPVVVECKFDDLQQKAGIRDEILRGT
jgi:hypothetical protein